MEGVRKKEDRHGTREGPRQNFNHIIRIMMMLQGSFLFLASLGTFFMHLHYLFTLLSKTIPLTLFSWGFPQSSDGLF